MTKQKVNTTLLRAWIAETFIYLGALSIFWLIPQNRSPNLLRPMSMLIRFGSSWVLLIIFGVLYVLFHLRGRLGKFLSLTGSLSLFAFGLAGVWASGYTQSTFVSSLIPLVDAQSYYVDALRLLAGRNILEFSAARPLFAGLLATLLAITNRNLLVAILILVGINGFACYFAARTLQQTHGTAPAVFLLILLFLYYRYRTIGAVMTENLGFAMGVLGATLIWRGIKDHSRKLILFGLLLVTLGLNARPGPFFLLPALLVWGSWQFKENGHSISWHFFWQGLFVIAFGFALNLSIKKLIGVSSAVPFSQFAYALYGLASGGNSFSYIFQVHPELRTMPFPQVTWTAYQYTFDLLRQHPTLILRGAFLNVSLLFSNSWYSLFSYARTENWWLNLVIQWFLYILCILGLMKWIQKPSDPYASMTVFATVSVLASAPFVPPADAYGLRLYAAGVVFLVLLPALGVAYLLEKVNFDDMPHVDAVHTRLITGYAVCLVLTVLLGPLFIKGLSTLPTTETSSCPPNSTSIVTAFDDGTYISVIREKDPGLDWIPVFHYGTLRRNAHSLPDLPLIQKIESMEPGTSLFDALDYHSNKTVLVIIPTKLLPAPGSVIGICGQWENDPNLALHSMFYADSTTVLPQP